MGFGEFISNVFYSEGLCNCFLLGDLVCIVRGVGRIQSFLVICRLLLDVESCKRILINGFILLITLFAIHNYPTS